MPETMQDIEAYYDSTMAAAPEAVKTFYLSLSAGDAKRLRAVLCDDFTFESPLASFDTPEGYVDMVGRFGGWVETSRFIVSGDHVAHTFVYHMTAPGKADIPVCEVFELEDGRIRSSRAYNNAADFPAEEC